MQSHVTLLGKDTILVISLTLVFKGLCVWGEILLPCFGKIKSLKSCICLAVPQVRFSYVIYCIYIWEARKESRQWKRVISNSWEQCSVLWAENKKKIYLQTRNDVLTKGDGREMGCYGGVWGGRHGFRQARDHVTCYCTSGEAAQVCASAQSIT